jgi:hypothetical protein
MDEDRPRLASLFPFFRSPLFADGGRASSEIETRIDKTMMEIIYHQIQLDDVYPETKIDRIMLYNHLSHTVVFIGSVF